MKDKIIIVEGPQGVGKTTVTNYLREHMAATDLYRLSGIKDKTEAGKDKIRIKYEKLIDYIENCCDINMIFDRTFFTNEVYSILGYQNYDFKDVYDNLLYRFDNMKNVENFDIYLIVLYLKDENLYNSRIKRDKHQYKKFEAESSILQQREYLKLADDVEKQAKHIHVIKFENDNEEIFNENIKNFLTKAQIAKA